MTNLFPYYCLNSCHLARNWMENDRRTVNRPQTPREVSHTPLKNQLASARKAREDNTAKKIARARAEQEVSSKTVDDCTMLEGQSIKLRTYARTRMTDTHHSPFTHSLTHMAHDSQVWKKDLEERKGLKAAGKRRVSVLLVLPSLLTRTPTTHTNIHPSHERHSPLSRIMTLAPTDLTYTDTRRLLPTLLPSLKKKRCVRRPSADATWPPLRRAERYWCLCLWLVLVLVLVIMLVLWCWC